MDVVVEHWAGAAVARGAADLPELHIVLYIVVRVDLRTMGSVVGHLRRKEVIGRCTRADKKAEINALIGSNRLCHCCAHGTQFQQCRSRAAFPVSHE